MKNDKIILKSIISRIKNISLVFFTLFICASIIALPQSSSRGVSGGISYCLNILIPSLFPFMFVASFIVKSGSLTNFQKVLSNLTKFLFYLPSCTAPTIFLSFIGGYPVGARGVKSLLDNKEINSEQAKRMMCFCINAGPAFILGVVGTTLLNSPFTGIIILTSQIISSLIIGVICAAKARTHNEFFYSKNQNSKHIKTNISGATISSCKDASQSMLTMCALVIIFSSVISIIQDINILNLISCNFVRFGIPKSESLTLLTSFLEITAGCSQAARLHANPAIISFAIGYGGVCVHLQIASILNQSDFKYGKFCLLRFFGAFISGILTYVGMKIFEKSEPVFSTISKPLLVSSSSTVHGSIALILLCVYFICTVDEKELATKK